MILGADIGSVVFDMDGVLWHSSAIHALAYKTILESAGLTMPDYAQIAGRRTNDVMLELLTAQHFLSNVDVVFGSQQRTEAMYIQDGNNYDIGLNRAEQTHIRKQIECVVIFQFPDSPLLVLSTYRKT